MAHAILLLGLHDGVPTATDRENQNENTPLDVIANLAAFKEQISKMTIEVSAEMVRLLGILAGCPEGSSQRELTMQGVKSSLIYEAVMLNLVRVKQEQRLLAAYRFHILPAGIQLLDVQG